MKVLVLIVSGFIASEKVASTVVPGETFCACSFGKTVLVVGAVVSTVHLRLAGVGSTFPALSMALTSKVCAPSTRMSTSGMDLGEVQLLKASLSSLHSKVAALTSDEKLKLAVVLLT